MLRFTSLAALVLAGGLWADDKPPAPPTPKPPTLSKASARVEGDTLQYQVVVQRLVPQRVAYTAVENGQAVTKTMTVQVAVQHVEARAVPLKDVQPYVANDPGADPTKRLSRLDPTKLADLLKKGPGVVTTADVQKADPAELKALKPGTIVLVLPTTKPAPSKPLPPAQPMPQAK